jgi:protein-disulfide isomerase
MADKPNSTQLFPAVVVLLLVIMAFLLGTLYQKVQLLEKTGGTKTVDTVGNQPSNNTPPPAVQAGEVEPVTDADQVRGDRNARIALIEYSDLECPYCQSFHPTAQQAVDEYDGQLMWVYRHYPLDFHPTAMPRAIASECIAKIGGKELFWDFIDKIFESSNLSAQVDLIELARSMGVNVGQFESCIADPAIAEIIQEDLALGTQAGVSGTPGNILLDTQTGETRLIPGAVPYSQLKSSIDELLAL